MTKEKRSNRSDHYQHLLVETAWPNEMLESFSNEESVYKRLNPFSYNDKIAELEDELKREFWRIVNEHLTERQRQVVRYYADGYTQQEIAGKLQVNQSSITKSLNGNVDYKHVSTDKNGGMKKTKKIYGGIKKRIRKLIEQDVKIREILQKISDLRDENWT
jgi:predicted DNA-binding protein YlxM (UPF0122 family)